MEGAPEEKVHIDWADPEGQTALHLAADNGHVECTKLVLAEGAADEGDLHCPKCACRVGAYAWYGAQCACGAWVAPAIQVTKSRVDEAAGVIVAPRTDPPRG